MITLISHISLGLLLGALCGVGMSQKHHSTAKLMSRVATLTGGLFMLTALASKLLGEASYSVELLADIVMAGVASALVLTLASINVSRAPQRSMTRRTRGLQG
jgi:hypothetical protein